MEVYRNNEEEKED